MGKKLRWKEKFFVLAISLLFLTCPLIHIIRADFEAPPIVNPKWTFSIDRGEGYSHGLSGEAILVKGSTVLAVTSLGEGGSGGWAIVALNSETGRLLWRKNLVACTLLAATEMYVLAYAFDQSLEPSLRFGLQCWRIEDGSHVWTSNVVASPMIGACLSEDQSTIYVLGLSGGRGELTAVRVENGAISWRTQLDEHSGLSYPSKPIYSDCKICFFQNDRKKLSAVDAETGAMNWSVELPLYGGTTDSERPIDTASETLPPLIHGELLIFRTLKTVWCHNKATGELSSRFNMVPEETKASGDDRVEKVGMVVYEVSLVLRSGPFWYVLSLPNLSIATNITYEHVSRVGYHLFPYASYDDALIGGGFCGPPYCTVGETYCGYLPEGVVIWVANPPANYTTTAAAVAQGGVLYVCYATRDILMAAYNYGEQVPVERNLSIEIVHAPITVELGEVDYIMIRVTWAGQGIPHASIRINSSEGGFAQPIGETDDGGGYITDFIPTVSCTYEVTVEATEEGFSAGNCTFSIQVTRPRLRVSVTANPSSIYRTSSALYSYYYDTNSTIEITVYHSRFNHAGGVTWETREPVSNARVDFQPGFRGGVSRTGGYTGNDGKFQTVWFPPRCSPSTASLTEFFCEEDWFTLVAYATKDGYENGWGSTSIHVKKAYNVTATVEKEAIMENTEQTNILVSVSELSGYPISGARVWCAYALGTEIKVIGEETVFFETNSSGMTIITWPPEGHPPGLYKVHVWASVSSSAPTECTSVDVRIVSSNDWDSDGITNDIDPFPLVKITLERYTSDPCLTYDVSLTLFENPETGTYPTITLNMTPGQDWILVNGKYGESTQITLDSSRSYYSTRITLDYRFSTPATGASTITFVDTASNNQSTYTLSLPSNYELLATNFMWAINGYSFPNPLGGLSGYCYGMSETAILFFEGLLRTISSEYVIAYEKTWDEVKGLIQFHQYRNLIGRGFTLLSVFPSLINERSEFDDINLNVAIDKPLIAMIVEPEKHAVVVTKIVKDYISGASYIFVYNPNCPYSPSQPLQWYLKFDGANFYREDGSRVHVFFVQPQTYIASQTMGYIYLKCPADLTIIDPQGRRIGYVNDSFVREIPNAAGMDVEGIEMYMVPRNVTYTILVNGTATGNYTLQMVFDQSHMLNIVTLNSTLSASTCDQIEIFANNSMFLINPSEDKAYSLQLYHLTTNASGTFDLLEVQAKKGVAHFISIPEWEKLSTPQATIVLGVDDNKDGKPDRQLTLHPGVSGEDVNKQLYPTGAQPWTAIIIIVVSAALLLALGIVFKRRASKRSLESLPPVPPPPPPPPQRAL
jgi:hypothetical protein